MTAPLYVDVSVLRVRHPTGIARFTARLLEALSRRRPLRLITLPDHRQLALAPQREIAIDRPLPAADDDVRRWTRALLRRSWRPVAAAEARRHACLYTMERPPQRLFAREVNLLYDFTPLLLPECHVPEVRHGLGRFFAHALPLSDGVVAISESTRHDASWLATWRRRRSPPPIPARACAIASTPRRAPSPARPAACWSSPPASRARTPPSSSTGFSIRRTSPTMPSCGGSGRAAGCGRRPP